MAEALEPTLYVIVKRSRPPNARLVQLAVYYVLHGCIYPAPAFHAVASTRLQRCAFQLRGSLESLQRALRPAVEGDALPPPLLPPVQSEEASRMDSFIMKVLYDFDRGVVTGEPREGSGEAQRRA